MVRTTEDARALLRTAREVHVERHGATTFTPGTHLPRRTGGGAPRHRAGQSPLRRGHRRGPGGGRGGHRAGRERALPLGERAVPHHRARPRDAAGRLATSRDHRGAAQCRCGCHSEGRERRCKPKPTRPRPGRGRRRPGRTARPSCGWRTGATPGSRTRGVPFRRVRARSAAGTPTGGVRASSCTQRDYRTKPRRRRRRAGGRTTLSVRAEAPDLG